LAFSWPTLNINRYRKFTRHGTLPPCSDRVPHYDDVDVPRRVGDDAQRGTGISESVTVGLDLQKNVPQVHGADTSGRAVQRKKPERDLVLDFFSQLPRCVVATEARGGANFRAREIERLGRDGQPIPPACVKPFVKLQKNDGEEDRECGAAEQADKRHRGTLWMDVSAASAAPLIAPAGRYRCRQERSRHLFAEQGRSPRALPQMPTATAASHFGLLLPAAECDSLPLPLPAEDDHSNLPVYRDPAYRMHR
jgi:hypothetical protein